MVDAKGLTLSVRITASTADEPRRECVFTASGRTITFPGFLRAYVETVDAEAGGEADDAERRLPKLTEGQRLYITELIPSGHVTTPPARYTEPSLIGALQDLGIGRPSTYTSIIRTIIDRGYVWKKGQALVPSWIAFAVDRAARAALLPARGLRLHRGDGGRARRHRRRPDRPHRLADRVLLRRRGRAAGLRRAAPAG